MPIVDGLTATKMIRSHEKAIGAAALRGAKWSGRIPVFAVSASLKEAERSKYVDAGFDAWILKPIDFHRLNFLLQGITEQESRNECLYEPGKWERGGWFQATQQEPAEADTRPDQGKQVAGNREMKSLRKEENDPIGDEQRRLERSHDSEETVTQAQHSAGPLSRND